MTRFDADQHRVAPENDEERERAVEFRADLQPAGDRLIVMVQGELDEYSGRDLRDLVGDVMNDYISDTIVLDLSRVVFMDSRGLGQLLSVCRSIERARRRVLLAEPSIHAQRVLESAGLADRFRED